jgi:hypothetical protein
MGSSGKSPFIWLLHYATANAARQNGVRRPNSTNRVWFDDLVLTEEYIGPIQAKGGPNSP